MEFMPELLLVVIGDELAGVAPYIYIERSSSVLPIKRAVKGFTREGSLTAMRGRPSTSKPISSLPGMILVLVSGAVSLAECQLWAVSW